MFNSSLNNQINFIPDYDSRITRQLNTTYTAEYPCFVYVSAGATGNLPNGSILINGTFSIPIGYTNTTGGYSWIGVYLSKGDTYQISGYYVISSFVCPLKGAY